MKTYYPALLKSLFSCFAFGAYISSCFLPAPAVAQNITFRSQVHYASEENSNVWGYATGGKEYALVGVYEGLSIVDVTDPDNPVELQLIPTQSSEWHEIKTWDHYAYVSNETGGGILIVDLSNLPGIVSYSYFTDPLHANLNTVHSIWIDEQGFLYTFGSNFGEDNHGGAEMYDLTVDPLNPLFVSFYAPVGDYTTDYIHDGFVRGDTLWASHIYIGLLEIVDISDKLNPVSLASFSTPNQFTHNAWPTHDNHYVFTTDEVDNSYLASYDVSDLSNITMLDKVQSHPGSNAIVHNVHLYNDSFAVTSYYTEGVVIFDVTHPDNMIKIGQYDESSLSGGGYGGDWGAYPYLPSGNLLVSDMEEGLFVLTPTYAHAAWLFGTVKDSITGALINNAEIEILNTENSTFSDLSGEYKTGAVGTGTYDISISKPGYATKLITGFSLQSGVYDTLDVLLNPLASFAYTGQLLDSATQQPVAFAEVVIQDALFTFTDTTDASGNFSYPIVYESSYDIFAGKWGYHTRYFPAYSINSGTPPIVIYINEGYYDDFATNLGWTETGDAQYGKWVRGEPVGTEFYGSQSNPETDVSNDYGDKCFVTGNIGTNYYDDPMYLGTTELISPAFDISAYENPYLDYYTWFYNVTYNSPANSLVVSLVQGTDSVVLQTLKFSNTPPSTWAHHKIRVKDFMTPGSSMSIRFYAENPLTSGNLLECGVDKFQIYDSTLIGINEAAAELALLNAFPNPFTDGFTIYYEFPSYSADMKIALTGLDGRKISDVKATDKKGTITLGDHSLPSGIYFVQLLSGKQIVKTVKLVKE